MIVAGFILAILSFLLGALPFVGWVLLVFATIFTAVGIMTTEMNGLSIASIVLIALTWIYKIILAALLAVLMSTGSENDERIDGEVQATEASEELKSETEKVKAINETFVVDNFEYTVTKMESLKTVGTDSLSKEASEGGVFVALQYTIKNIGKEPASFLSYPSTNLMDNEGTVYSSDVDASWKYAVQTDIENGKVLSDLNPGISVTETSVYEISEEQFANGEWFFALDKKVKVKIK